MITIRDTNQFLGNITSSSSNNSVKINLQVNKTNIEFEVDSGAAITCSSAKTFKKYFSNINLENCCKNLSVVTRDKVVLLFLLVILMKILIINLNWVSL